MPKKKSAPARRAKTNAPQAAPDSPGTGRPFMVVGIGASAGGVDAFKKLFTAMPDDTGMAFVLIPHLDPTHASMMVELLRPNTRMPVHDAGQEVDVQPDTVYIIPPNHDLEILHGKLYLFPLTEPHTHHTPIDRFLRSLAEDRREAAVGILLSGTGSYGTLGLDAIKEHGGMTLVQDPAEAQHNQMPRSAIAAGVADHVLPLARMPETLVAYRDHPYVKQVTASAETGSHLARILALLKARTKYDFSDYRKGMLARRIQRRMGLMRIKDPNGYIDVLRDNNEELMHLFNDFFIGVSGFFREPEAYDVLAQQVIPELIRLRAGSDSPVRIWIPACASGEEAYSIAMLMLEALDRIRRHPPFLIFATDINEPALKKARLGLYPESIVADVGPERLKRFFNRTDHHYQVKKHLRECVMFAEQNVITDTPFSRLDLISCRNLLIYLEPEAQQKILALFHFALNEGGYLFLGASETVGRQIDLFEPLSKKWRIFRRIGPSRTNLLEFPTGIQQNLHKPTSPLPGAAPRIKGIGAQTLEYLSETFAPASVLINRKFEVLYLHGPTHKYIGMPAGEPTSDLLAMTQEGLNTRIRSLCYQVSNNKDGEASGDVRLKRNGQHVTVRVHVREIHHHQGLEGLLLVTFEDLNDNEPTDTVKVADAADRDTLIQQLEYELKATREDLQSTIEELESSNEELKSSNEEMMSMNEELQSVNEELESSKEELQSLNEELNTINNQLEEKVDELDNVNNDLNNLLNSADITALFLDTHMRIRRFTPSTVKLLNLLPSDTGRSISDFAYKFNDDALLSDSRAVLAKLVPIDKHVWTNEGACYLRRIQPYRTLDNQIEGVVVNFVDITPQVLADIELSRVEEMLKDFNVAIIVKELDGRITAWNHGAERMFGYTAAEALKMNAYDLIPAELRNKTRSIISKIAKGKDIDTVETRRVTKDGQVIDIALTATRLMDSRGNVVGIIATERDITDRKRTEQDLLSHNRDLKDRVAIEAAEAVRQAALAAQREQYLSAIISTAPDAIITMDHTGLIKSFNPMAQQMLGYAEDEVMGKHISLCIPTIQGKMHDISALLNLQDAKPWSVGKVREIHGHRKDGTTVPMEMGITNVDHMEVYIAILRDISERKNLEAEIIQMSSREQERIGREIHDGLGQRLTALTMLASSIEHKFTAQKHIPAAKLEELTSNLQEASREAQALSRGLAPVAGFPGGLRSALKTLIDNIHEITGVNCRLSFPRSLVIADDHPFALQLYRIAQEAVNNAVKHANAKNIRVTVSRKDDGLVLKVSDDGQGFRSKKRAGEGIGTHIMKYRADIIGGKLEIDSQAGKGTTILCTVPHGDTGV